jgi:alpha-glucosidase
MPMQNEGGGNQLWWQTGVVYQVYPRSFQDTSSDGVGDLAGILARLDALVDLGVDAIWVSPFYPSPMADFGYDVADYTGVDPLFGTLDDFDRLIAGAHARGLKLILDFVPNHTSDQHPWFLDSRESRTSSRRDWYLWHDPAPDGGPPNNWPSHFGGSGWTLDEPTGQYYFHSFLREQPDLNWRNPAVRDAIYAAMRFWLERGPGGRGVDGFRMDVLWLLIKDDQFRSNPPNPNFHGDTNAPLIWQQLPLYTADQPETHEIVATMRALLDSYSKVYPRVLIGEIYLPITELVRYYGKPGSSTVTPQVGNQTAELTGAQMPFNFHLIQTPWQAERIADLIRRYEAALPPGAWPNWVLGNHDQKRLASRVGAAQARVAAVLLLTLRGTPTLYYGDELGMPDANIAPGQIRDPAEKNQPGRGLGRDPERSPMIWDESENAGFCPAEIQPWLPLVDDWPELNHAAQLKDEHSTLAVYRCLLALRRRYPALHSGAISDVAADHGVLQYVRRDGAARIQVHLNLTEESQSVRGCPGTVLVASGLDCTGERRGENLWVLANSAVVVLCDP